MPWRVIVSFFAVLFWIQGEITCEKDINTCIFNYWQVDWTTAVKTCQKENTHHLLCYKSKKDIDDITEAFRLAAIGSAKLVLWLSSRNCSSDAKLEKCLSLHIQKSGDTVWHYFQETCDNSYQFVCCINSNDESTTSVDYISTSMNSISDVFNITDNSSLLTTTHTASSLRSAFCGKVFKRGIYWPDTDVGKISIRPCPGNSTGQAWWTCEHRSSTGEWENSGPDLTNCRSREIQDLKERFNSTSASNVISELQNIFHEPNTQVFGEDLVDVIFLMTTLPDRLFLEMESFTSSVKWTATKDSVDKATSIIDGIVKLGDTWEDVEKNSKLAIGTRLLSTVDGMGSLLADAMPENVTEQSIIGKNMVLQVLRPKPGESVYLPQWLITRSYSHRGGVLLEEGYDKDQENVSLVFSLYCNMSSILTPTEEKENNRSSLNSAVLGVTVNQGREYLRIHNKVKIFLEHLTTNPTSSACVFWDMYRDQWDTTGCYMESSNETYTVCVCNHLTNFALLMDYQDVLENIDHDPFHYITLIGCSLSVICLAMCVILFSCYSYCSRHPWGVRYVIHRNLCLTLLIANLVLVIGLDKTENKIICAIIAGFLHYFFLSAFSWMFLEAVHIYLLLVVVFASRKTHSEKYYIFGYGFPLVVVAITAFSRPRCYGRDDICWLSSEKGTIWSFIGPVAVILLLNTAALLLAQYKASHISMKNDKSALLKRWLRVTLILFPILGVTWVFGFLYLGKYFEVAGYLFAIFNSFQGVCIFVCHCLLDKKARSMILDSLKKRNTSMDTGSSGTQKKKEVGQNGVKSNSISPIDNDNISTRDTFQLSNGKNKKDLPKWQKPWSFCVEMPVSDRKAKKEQDSKPQAIVVHWNSLTDKNCT